MRKVFILAIAVLLGAGAFYYFEEKSNKNDDLIILHGNVDVRDMALSFRIPGRVSEMRCEEGDHVKHGQVVAGLDKEPFEKEVAIQQAELARSQAALVMAENEFQRQKSLFHDKVSSEREYDNAKAGVDEAKAVMDGAHSLLEQSMIRLRDTEIIAPNDGIILTRVQEPGAIVAVGSPIYTMALEKPVWIRTYIDEPNLGNLHAGQNITVLTDSGKSYQGQVGFISPQAEFTPKNIETAEMRTSLVYRLRVIIAEPDNGLRQGMPVVLQMKKEAVPNAASN